MTVPNPPILGHHLIDEGHTFPIRRFRFDLTFDGEITGHRGGCQCGAKPEGFPNVSVNAMKRWHREHKAEIRRIMDVDPALVSGEGPTISTAEAREVLRQAGFEGERLYEAMTIAERESKGTPSPADVGPQQDPISANGPKGTPSPVARYTQAMGGWH